MEWLVAGANATSATLTLVAVPSPDDECNIAISNESKVSQGLVWMGTAMVIAASFLSCFGLNLQKLSHNKNEEKEMGDRKSMFQSWRWLLGMICMVSGSVLDMLALPFVPMSRVSALGASGMIANIIITPLFLGEKLTKHDLIGGGITVIGTTVACVFGAQKEPVVTSDCLLENFKMKMFIFFAVCVVFFQSVMFYLMKGFQYKQAAAVKAGLCVQYMECVAAWENEEKLKSLPQHKKFHFYTQMGPQFYPVVHAVFAGTCGAFSVMFAKAVLLFFSNAVRGTEVGKSIGLGITFVIPTVVCVMAQIHYLNFSLQIYRDALFVLPVYQSLWITAGTLSGMIFYREYEGISTSHMVLFIFGVLISLFGIVVLARRVSETPEVSSPLLKKDDHDALAIRRRSFGRGGSLDGRRGSFSAHSLLARGSLAESFSLRPGDTVHMLRDPLAATASSLPAHLDPNTVDPIPAPAAGGGGGDRGSGTSLKPVASDEEMNDDVWNASLNGHTHAVVHSDEEARSAANSC